MTLTKKMAVGVLSVLMIIFIGTFLITFHNERNFFIKQMTSNAQDTATSLGLSLSHALHNKDKPMMLSMVEAVFDRGYFAMIEVRDMNDEILIARYAPKRIGQAPDWFTNLIDWPASVQSALVMRGWQQVGEVLVSSDSSYACDALWNSMTKLACWYLLFAFVSLVIVFLFIRWLLKPLSRLRNQAEAICDREFPIESVIPSTPELKKVTLAMNQMVLRIKRLFQEQLQQIDVLRQQSYQDPLTGLGNRRYFLQQLSALLNHDEEFLPGFMILVAIDGLDRLNQESGYQQGDKTVRKVAKTCVSFWKKTPSTMVARISGSHFALLVKESETSHFINQCNEFNQIIQALLPKDSNCTISIAATAYQLHQTPETLLADADQVLHDARTQAGRMAYSPDIPVYNAVTVDAQFLLAAISERKLVLYAQPITDGQSVLHQEIFVRLPVDGENFSAGYFMPLAIRHGLAHKIDQLVLDTVLAKDILAKQDVALNLTQATLLDEANCKQYLGQLKKIPQGLRERLSIELNELIVMSHFNEVESFVRQLQKLKIRIGVDQVGIHFSPMHYLNQLPVNYLKLHGSLIYDIQDNQNKQFFIHYFNEMAKTLDIEVIATQIESEKQWSSLKNLHLQWGQGRYLGKVQPV
ncbi:EAL domain-containing protein [Legionella spiritensis]|uniref:Two component histidine kinase n=1 Tax=Legionella spiritensis TaxID=452 RepID=A0A0W0ZBH6_LEGSP|nr:EAL domain-containing protein [Legionella spiritensis]KTD66174.1 two component histidine kinase [Legionella spiritensis]SNV35048.1 two component histidine kinase, GGDEF domain protein/EAL domain protein [Legionella spiritensis]